MSARSRPPLAERLGVEVPPGLAAELERHLLETAEASLEDLRAVGRIPATAAARQTRLATLALPRSVAEVLAVAITEARARGDHAHAEALLRHHLESLPQARLEQLLSDRPPYRWLFHEPAPWHALPRFRRGLERLFTLFSEHSLDARAALGAPDPDAWCAARPTLADFYLATYYGRLLPMFAALPHDLARLDAEVHADPARRWELVDRRLGNAMLHELLHFGTAREAIFPPYLDEAIAAHLGLLLDERVAFPPPGDDCALVGWPWFSQVGAALARVAGDGPLLAAQAGLVPWTEALPPALLARLEAEAWAAYRAAPAVHFHPDTTRPDRWVRLVHEMVPPPPDPERDLVMLTHALHAMCLQVEQPGGSFRVSRRAPDGPILIDFAAGVVRAPPRHLGLEPAPALHALPPCLIAPRAPLELTLDPDPSALEALARRLLTEVTTS